MLDLGKEKESQLKGTVSYKKRRQKHGESVCVGSLSWEEDFAYGKGGLCGRAEGWWRRVGPENLDIPMVILLHF